MQSTEVNTDQQKRAPAQTGGGQDVDVQEEEVRADERPAVNLIGDGWKTPYIVQGKMNVLADTGATRSCVSRVSIDAGIISVARYRQVKLMVKMADAAPVLVTQVAEFTVVSLEGVSIRVSALVLPRLAACDVLLGMDILGNTRHTAFDWYGKKLLLELETGLVSFRIQSSRKKRTKLRTVSEIKLVQGINQISQEELGIYLSNSVVEGKSFKRWMIPQQYFDLNSNENVTVIAHMNCSIPKGFVTSRITPVSMEERQNKFFFDTVVEEARAAREEVSEFLREVETAIHPDKVGNGQAHEDDGAKFDHPTGPPRPREKQQTWERLLGRDATKDPGYVESTEDAILELLEELQLKHNEVFQVFTPVQKAKVREILRRYAHVWKKTVTPVDKSVAEHAIDTGNATPVFTRQYPLNQWQKEGVRNFVKELLAQGLIQESTSPWCSPLLVVPKPDGSPRVCFDARKLNEVTKKDRYPVPNIKDCLSRMSGCGIFSTGDALSGFWQIPVKLEDRMKTAFATAQGLFEHTVMPFGLCNAPPTFCRAMDKIMGELRSLFVILYVDDWMIPTKSGPDMVDEHLKQLEALLAKFSIAGMSLKASKTYLFQSRVKFLGHIVSAEGLGMDPEKVEVIQRAKAPTSKAAIKSWVGAVGYYRHFIKQLAEKLKPINNLTADNVRFGPTTAHKLWTPTHQRLFEEVKTALTSLPVLAHPDFDKPFEIHTDASVSGLGATLVQYDDNGREHPVEYASRGLSDTESRYEARELECLALLFAIRKFHRYLSPKFTAVVDHKNLLNLQSYVRHNRRLIRWAIELSQYEINMKHKKGSEHVVADLCSRLPEFVNGRRRAAKPEEIRKIQIDGNAAVIMEPMDIIVRGIEDLDLDGLTAQRFWESGEDLLKFTVISAKGRISTLSVHQDEDPGQNGKEYTPDKMDFEELTIPTKIKFSNPVVTREEIRKAQEQDSAWNAIRMDLRRRSPRLKHTYLYRLDEDGLLRYTGSYIFKVKKTERNKKGRIVIPQAVRKRLIWNYHNPIETGHTGHINVYERIARHFTWPNMFTDVRKEIQRCSQCRKAKLTNTSRKDRLKTVLTQLPFEILYIDHVQIPAKNAGGYTHVVTMMDGFSRFLVAECVRATDARSTCRVVWDRIVCALGRIPAVIVCDNGFDSDEWRAFCRDIGAKPAVTSPYNPRANRVERTHRFLKALLRIASENMGQSVWPQLIQTTVRAYNAQIGKKGLSPFQVLFGFQPDFPIENILFRVKRWGKLWDENKFFSALVEALRNNHRKARILDTRVADDRIFKAIRDPKRYDPGFQRNDLVLWRQSRRGSRKQGTATKLFYQCTGPHRILERKADHDLYAIELGTSGIRKEWIPGEHLQKIPARIETTVTKPRNTSESEHQRVMS